MSETCDEGLLPRLKLVHQHQNAQFNGGRSLIVKPMATDVSLLAAAEVQRMIHLTAHTPILVAIAPADFRRGIDGFVALCQHQLGQNPRSGTLYVFQNRARTMVRILAYESDHQGQGGGYWLATQTPVQGALSRLAQSRSAPQPTGCTPLAPTPQRYARLQ